jgi:hypothetical protein
MPLPPRDSTGKDCLYLLPHRPGGRGVGVPGRGLLQKGFGHRARRLHGLILQLRSDSPITARYARDGSGNLRSCMVDRRNHCAAGLAGRNSALILAHQQEIPSYFGIPDRADKSQVERIRNAIRANGECIVEQKDLHTLWIRELNADSESGAIWALAVSEHWSFTISPNGSVRFAPLDSN